MALTLMYITNKPEIALIAEKSGVDRIWVDLEVLGKEERQKNMDSVKSHHTVKDVQELSNILTSAELMVRINPWNDNSVKEIDEVINAGAQRIMLPMWKTKKEVDAFLCAVNGRVKTTLLLETKEAVECLDEVLQNPRIDEMHIGLNDLHLSYGLRFMFELLTNGTVEKLCEKIKKANVPFGFGGIARLGEGMLPAEKVIMEHYRLGSTRAILSRSFCNAEQCKCLQEISELFSVNMQRLRYYEQAVCNESENSYALNRKQVEQDVKNIVNAIKKKE